MLRKEPVPMHVINLCRHKIAGWEGAIFLDGTGEVMVTDGSCVWSMTPARMKSLEFVETVNMQRLLHHLAFRQNSTPLIALLREGLSGFRQDVEYLARPLIEDVRYEISDTRVSIRCPHTCFIDVPSGTYFDQQALLDSYREILRIAKTHDVRISYSLHIKKLLKTRWEEYEADVAERNRTFRWLSAQAQVVQLRGIHRGCSDDKELSLLTELQGRIIRYGYRNSVASQIASAAHALETLRRDLPRTPERYAMITL